MENSPCIVELLVVDDFEKLNANIEIPCILFCLFTFLSTQFPCSNKNMEQVHVLME